MNDMKIPEGWQSEELGYSLIPLPKSKHPSGISDDNGYYNFYVCSSDIQKSFQCDVNDPAILFSTGGEAAIHYATGKYSFSTDVWATKFSGKLTNEFVFRFLDLNKNKINNLGFQGSGIKHLEKNFVKKLNIIFPPLSEQKKIASILTSVDEVIEKTQSQINKIQDLKKATMNELLTKGIGHTEFKDSELGRIPKNWEIGRFDNFITLQRGHDLPVQERLDGEIPIYGSNGIVGYHIDTSICEGGVITGRSGSIGDVHFEEGKYWALNTTLYVREFNKNDKKFVFYFLNHFNLKRFSTGTGVPTLNRNDLHLQTVAIPDLVEQVQISNILDKIEICLNKKKHKLFQTQSLKKSLMQVLLTGKVRVKVN